MTEQWSKWEPLQGLSNKYYVDSISDTMEEFEIILSDANDRKKKLRISTEYSPHSYQVTKISYKFKIISNLTRQHNETLTNKWTFFRVTNSSYLQLMSEESAGISDDRELTHVSILAQNLVIDIVDGFEPKVEWLEDNLFKE